MKTPEEIKEALRCCIENPCDATNCPYATLHGEISCHEKLYEDAIAYIKKLESKIKSAENHVGWIKLTYRGGSPCYIKADTITSFGFSDEVSTLGGTIINCGANRSCVIESVEDILSKITNANIGR